MNQAKNGTKNVHTAPSPLQTKPKNPSCSQQVAIIYVWGHNFFLPDQFPQLTQWKGE